MTRTPIFCLCAPLLLSLIALPKAVTAAPELSAVKATPLKSEALTLADLISCARGNNPAWEVAHAQLEEARAKLRFADASLFPSVKVTGALAPLPARRILRYCVEEDGVNVSPCPNQDVFDDERLHNVDGMGVFGRTQVTVTQPLYTFGKISNGREAARAGVEAYQAGLSYAEQSLDLRAAQTYFGLQLAVQLERILKKGRSKLNKFKADIKKNLDKETGKYTSNDMRRVVIQEGDLVSRSLEIEALKRQAIASVRVACMLPKEAKVALASVRLKPLSAEPMSYEALLDLARAQRFDLKMARAQVTAREALASKAISDLLPDLGLIGALAYSVGTSAEDHPDPFANDPFNGFGYGFYLGLNWSFSAARLLGNPRQARAALRKARAQLKGLEQLVKLELIEHTEQLRRHEKTLTAKKEAMRAAKQWMTSTFINLSSGLVTSGRILNTLKSYFQASAAYEQAVYEYNVALTRLWRAVGMDLSERLTRTTDTQ